MGTDRLCLRIVGSRSDGHAPAAGMLQPQGYEVTDTSRVMPVSSADLSQDCRLDMMEWCASSSTTTGRTLRVLDPVDASIGPSCDSINITWTYWSTSRTDSGSHRPPATLTKLYSLLLPNFIVQDPSIMVSTSRYLGATGAVLKIQQVPGI
ncbi:hypothetical protein P153DRAFT_196240 [Dothidotthia symphoricarpi CBS 119687]|uniref:Uncharacterized protein n=1 Tax=Dothidotthia symphoricarpi CBS 119687 TaxID=1392245 RepID=A0A6A6AHQ9_9PLEO|nr:uncharacterized protein P153DRAFT_196240 [Dothidotthia symphoricarpi CBS 119687]KAF2131479.1 hypothetical protein P153DRAFT_196240 [Dothidotthia symphoricarpi CBS 119687]